MSKIIIAAIITSILVIGIAISSISVIESKTKKLNCEIAPEIYYLKPSEISSVKPILNSNENALIVIPETHEIRANTKLLECPNIDIEKYVWGNK